MSFYTDEIGLGQLGGIAEIGTDTRTAETGKWWAAIQVVNDAKFHTLTGTIPSGDTISNTTLASAITIPAGIIIYGRFTEFKLHSGAVIAYNGGV
jgi:hypothetical protein